jgi:hypothetical protein
MGAFISKHEINEIAIAGAWLILLLALRACRLLLVTLDFDIHMSVRALGNKLR